MNLDEVSIVIGLDWADRTHVCSLLNRRGEVQQVVRVGASPEAFGSWLEALERRYPQGRLVLAVEKSEGALVEMVRARPRLALVPVNPVVLHRFRQAFAPSGAKNDPGDATLLGQIVLRHPEQFDPLKTPDELAARLAALAKERRHWVDARTGLLEELISLLKKYYPQALELAGENLASPMALEFLQRWPELPALKKAPWRVLEKFYRHHHSGREAVLRRRRELIEAARSVSEREAYLQPCRLHLLAIVRQIAALNASIAQFDAAIAELYAQAPGREVIDSLPGAGPALGPRLWAGCASEGKAPDAETLQLKSGIAPVQKQSGGSKAICFRWARPRFLHQTWTEFAHHSLVSCSWARAYYQQRKAKGHGEGAILRGLAFKWIRIVARLWKDQICYDESFYLKRCAARQTAP